METKADKAQNWAEELADFLRQQPGVGAVRIDPTAHKVEIATLGLVDLADLQARLADTIAAVEKQWADRAAGKAPAGFVLRRRGVATVGGAGSTAAPSAAAGCDCA